MHADARRKQPPKHVPHMSAHTGDERRYGQAIPVTLASRCPQPATDGLNTLLWGAACAKTRGERVCVMQINQAASSASVDMPCRPPGRQIGRQGGRKALVMHCCFRWGWTVCHCVMQASNDWMRGQRAIKRGRALPHVQVAPVSRAWPGATAAAGRPQAALAARSSDVGRRCTLQPHGGNHRGWHQCHVDTSAHEGQQVSRAESTNRLTLMQGLKARGVQCTLALGQQGCPACKAPPLLAFTGWLEQFQWCRPLCRRPSHSPHSPQRGVARTMRPAPANQRVVWVCCFGGKCWAW